MLRYLEELLFPFITTYKVRDSISTKMGNFKTKDAFQRLELPGQGPVS